MWNIIAASALLDIKKRFDNIRNTSKYELSFYKGFQVIAKVCWCVPILLKSTTSGGGTTRNIRFWIKTDVDIVFPHDEASPDLVVADRWCVRCLIVNMSHIPKDICSLYQRTGAISFPVLGRVIIDVLVQHVKSVRTVDPPNTLANNNIECSATVFQASSLTRPCSRFLSRCEKYLLQYLLD